MAEKTIKEKKKDKTAGTKAHKKNRKQAQQIY